MCPIKLPLLIGLTFLKVNLVCLIITNVTCHQPADIGCMIS